MTGIRHSPDRPRRSPPLRPRRLACCLLWLAASPVFAAPAPPPPATPLEQADYAALPDNEAVLAYLDRLASAYSNARRIQLGQSADGRPIGGLLVSGNPDFLETAAFRSGMENPRLRAMLVAGQHGDETATTEALQVIARELLVGDLADLPDSMDLILVPAASPDGRDLRRRTNGAGENVNTDYILLTQPESQALSAALTRFRPDTVMDIHESSAYKEDTLARQGYVTFFDIQYEVGFEPNIDRRLRRYGVDVFLPALIQRAAARKLNARRYILEIRDVNEPVTHGGITLRNFRNYSGSSNALSTLVEGRIDPPGDYPTPDNIRERTEELAGAIAAYLRQVHAMREPIKQRVQAAREQWQGPVDDGGLALKSEFALDPEQPRIRIPLREIDSGAVIEKPFDYHGRVVTLETFRPPAGYLVTAHQDRVAELLKRHGVIVDRLDQPVALPGRRRTIRNLEVTPPPPERRRYTLALQVDSEPATVTGAPGDLFIDLAQPDGRRVPLLLEPLSTTSIYQEPGYTEMLETDPFYLVPVDRAPADQKGSAEGVLPAQ
ncbi:MAG: hypothetical protein CMN28_00280 [Salinisphaeraceae bacterium]|nr:hypothetical protein [Salinisphaeraceae bacterium]